MGDRVARSTERRTSGCHGPAVVKDSSMTTSSPLDPAVASVLEALGRQRQSLDIVLARLDMAQNAHLPSSPHVWKGVAARAQTAAVCDLRDIIQSARSALERARSNTSTAIDELNSRV